MPFAPITDAIDAIRCGDMVVLVDDEDRENEGDIVIAAEFATPESIAFMATKACGLICLAMEGPMLDRLGLPMMTPHNRAKLGTAFTVSIEAAEGITTGISAADRAVTIQAAIADEATPESVVSPGHVFPLRAVEGGVLVRPGQTEGSVDLARLAGCKPAGVICEIMKADGTMARLDDLVGYCHEHGLLLCSIADLIAYRERTDESLIDLVAEATIDTAIGPWQAYAYRSRITDEHHLALVRGGDLGPGKQSDAPVLVRVQQELTLTDAFDLLQAPRVGSIDALMRAMASADASVLLYMRDARGGRLPDQLVALGGTRHGSVVTTAGLSMDPRSYGIGALILRDLGVRRMRLMTASEYPLKGLSGYGLEVVDRVRPPSVAGEE